MTTKGKLIIVGVAVVALGMVFVSGGLGSNLASSALKTARVRIIPPTTNMPMTTEILTTSIPYSSEEVTTSAPALPTLYPQIIYSGNTSNQPGEQPKSQCDNTINNYVVQLKPTFQDIESQPFESCQLWSDDERSQMSYEVEQEAVKSGNKAIIDEIRNCLDKQEMQYKVRDTAIGRCSNNLRKNAVNPSHFDVKCPSCPSGSEGCQPFSIIIEKPYPINPNAESGAFLQQRSIKKETRSFISEDGHRISFKIVTITYVLVCGANEQKQVIFQGGCKACTENCTSLICPGDIPTENSAQESSC